jgi:hypothetical protein
LNEKAAVAEHSMHLFQGYGLLQDDAVPLAKEGSDRLVERLLRVPSSVTSTLTTEELSTLLVTRCQALTALQTNSTSLDFTTAVTFSEMQLLDTNALVQRLSVACQWKTASCQWIANEDTATNDDATTTTILRITFHPVTAQQYAVLQYTVPRPPSPDAPAAAAVAVTLFVRERVHRNLSLQEMVSQVHTAGIDNTGNVCVWDASKTLAWAVHRDVKNNNNVQTVTELGAGMVGLAGLSLAAWCRDNSSSSKLQQLYVTDGHAAAVQNNRVHVSLLRAADLLPVDCQVQCCTLKWSIDNNDENNSMLPPPSDWTLVADCTHFEEYHAALFWTLCRCTAVSGTAWLCQPDRAGTLQRFLNLVAAVNTKNDDPLPLWHAQERCYEVLQSKHEHFLRHSTAYNPNLHRPHIFVLEKLRPQRETDRLAALAHVQER